MQEQQYQYRVTKPADDVRDAVIEKSGLSSVEFTLRDLETKRIQWSKEKRELEGQITIEQAKVDNIAHHHPFVIEMSEQDQYAVWMYYEAMKTVTELTKQRDMRINALDEYQKEEEHIMGVLGFTKSAV